MITRTQFTLVYIAAPCRCSTHARVHSLQNQKWLIWLIFEDGCIRALVDRPRATCQVMERADRCWISCSARYQSSSEDPSGLPLSCQNWYARTATSRSSNDAEAGSSYGSGEIIGSGSGLKTVSLPSLAIECSFPVIQM
jgi:hypothetical protein